MNTKWIISIFSLLANIYYHGLWLFVYQNYSSHESRLDAFSKMMPLSMPILNISIVLLIMSFISIWAIQALKMNKLSTSAYILLQILFIGMFVWSLL